MTVRATILAACASALLLWASMPPIGLGMLAWVALVPVAAVALRSAGSRQARLAVPLAYGLFLELLLVQALPFGIADDQWGDPPLPVMVGDSPLLAVALLAVPLFTLALYGLRFPSPRPSRSAVALVIVPAACWTALDFGRVKLDPGGVFGPLFASQQDTPAASLAALGGPWTLTFAIVAVNYALALVIVRRSALVAAAAVGAAVVVTATAGAAILAPGGADGPSVRVAAIQPGYDTSEFERPVLRHFHPGSYDLAALDMIRDLGPLTNAAAGRGAEVVVWPEAALWVDPRRSPRVRVALASLARESRASIVVPYFVEGPDEGATVIVSERGRISPAQPKQRPMWFLGERGGNRISPRPVATDHGLIGTTLGVDNQDPRSVRELAASDAALVSSSTHDWKQLAPHQRALSRLHTIESSIPVVRADWRYGSAIFESGGTVAADAGDDRRRAVLVAEVHGRDGSTPYVRIGDVLGWVAAAAGLALVLAGVATGRASRARAASRRSRLPAPSSPA